jgi:ABC-type multidrug transport system permease subunit
VFLRLRPRLCPPPLTFPCPPPSPPPHPSHPAPPPPFPDTLIGNDLVRGVSGGERKRVTVGEGIMTRARALFCDEISTGLDSSVTYSVVNRLKGRAQRERLGVVIALLQPTPEVYDLFDDVILMREGHVVYHGPRTALLGYFRGLGFHPPPPVSHAQQSAAAGKKEEAGAAVSAVEEGAMDTADWLAEILAFPHRTHERDLARVRATPGGEALVAASPAPPLEPQAMADAWAASGDLYARSTTLPANAAPLVLHSDFAKEQYGQLYVHSALHHVRSVTKRQFKLMGRNSLFLGFRVFSATFMAMVFAGLYWRGDVDDGVTKYGLFLNALMHVAFANVSEMSSAVENKYVAHRHVANGVHPAFAFPLSNVLAHLPLAAAESIVFCTITYFLCGMTEEAGRFFFYVMLVFLVDVFAAVLFRTFAFSAPTLITAQAGPMPVSLFGGVWLGWGRG